MAQCDIQRPIVVLRMFLPTSTCFLHDNTTPISVFDGPVRGAPAMIFTLVKLAIAREERCSS